MCEFVNKFFVDNTKIQRKFKVLRFLYETPHVWMFRVYAFEEMIHGKKVPISTNEKDMAFPKKKTIILDGRESTQELPPPPFYNRMRNLAILSGRIHIQGDDEPPLGHKSLF